MSETLDKEATVKWIKETMKSMGTPPAYSYRVGVYHGMEQVLKKIESGEFTVGGRRKAMSIQQWLWRCMVWLSKKKRQVKGEIERLDREIERL